MKNQKFFQFSPVSPEAILFNLLSPAEQYRVRGQVFRYHRNQYAKKAMYRLDKRARIHQVQKIKCKDPAAQSRDHKNVDG